MSDLLKAAQQASQAPLVKRSNQPNSTNSTNTWQSRHVRKTLHLQTDLLEKAKTAANEQGISLSALVNKALAQTLDT